METKKGVDQVEEKHIRKDFESGETCAVAGRFAFARSGVTGCEVESVDGVWSK